MVCQCLLMSVLVKVLHVIMLSTSLKALRSVLMNAIPKEDFGGKESPSHGHADPNLAYAVELVKAMGTNKTG